MVSKVIRELYIDYDHFEEYDKDVMYYLADCKITTPCIILDKTQKFFKEKNGKPVAVLHYNISIDTEELLWIKLTAPKIILKEVSISL